MPEPKVGDIYWDCAYHAVLCTELDEDDVAGVSLFDGSEPRSCSIYHCGVTWLNEEQVNWLLDHKLEFLGAETTWTIDNHHAYNEIFNQMPSDLFPGRTP